jgi:hypothetical protein
MTLADAEESSRRRSWQAVAFLDHEHLAVIYESLLEEKVKERRFKGSRGKGKSWERSGKFWRDPMPAGVTGLRIVW